MRISYQYLTSCLFLSLFHFCLIASTKKEKGGPNIVIILFCSLLSELEGEAINMIKEELTQTSVHRLRKVYFLYKLKGTLFIKSGRRMGGCFEFIASLVFTGWVQSKSYNFSFSASLSKLLNVTAYPILVHLISYLAIYCSTPCLVL